MKNSKNFGSFSGKGYYIALILCAAAIGISGYLYYRNVNEHEPSLQDPATEPQIDVISPTQEDMEAVAPRPQPDVPDPRPSQPQKQPLKTASPVDGEVIGSYAMDCLSYNETTRDWRVHNGIDIAAKAGTEVKAAADGVVYTTCDDEKMGTTVVIRHADGYVTVYASLDKKLAVKAGDPVCLGQVIGCTGNTAMLESAMGDHLHFSVSCNEKPVNPRDFLKIGS